MPEPRGVRRSDARSKLARVLGERLPSPAPAPRLGRKATAGEVVLAYLREQAEAIGRGDPAVRRDAPDAVHQMRVATASDAQCPAGLREDHRSVGDP
jgi:hypothetical protein